MTRILRIPALLVASCVAVGLPAAAADAAAPTYPSVSKVSPLKLGVGDTLTLRGKNFRTGKGRNTVVFKRTGGRAVFVKAGRATRTKLSVTIPAKLLTSLTQKSGKPVATRFRLRVLTGRFGRRFTSTKGSPVIGPTSLAKKVTAADCDGDLLSNAKDTDDDNDLLSDSLEATLKTDACKRDTDGDGMSDAWEQESALDYNGRALPTPLRRPYPNALDPKDGTVDSDGDGLTNAVEYVAWATYGNRKLPLNYSGGNPASTGKEKTTPANAWWDRDANGFLSDNERDADGDGIPNQDEGGLDPLPVKFGTVGFFSDAYIALKEVRAVVDVVPLYGPLEYVHKVQGTSWIDADSDGDTVRDGADDQDGDGVANLSEVLAELATPAAERQQLPVNPCAPSLDSRSCIAGDDDIDRDGLTNRDDTDDDGDKLDDATERQFRLNPFKADTDGDGVSDGYEYYSAKDLNGGDAVPYPGKRPYPNALDPEDANRDHDGDGLTLANEFQAWTFTGGQLPLSYSDGNPYTAGAVDDGERDVDGDGATNFSEVAGPLSGPGWWTKWVADQANRPGCVKEYVESPYPGVAYKGLNFVDGDTDGDGILDGADDIDHDGLSNLSESAVRRVDWCSVYVSQGPGAHPGTDPGARTDPFNPCKPYNSRFCHIHPPIDYYVSSDTFVEDWMGAPGGPLPAP